VLSECKALCTWRTWTATSCNQGDLLRFFSDTYTEVKEKRDGTRWRMPASRDRRPPPRAPLPPARRLPQPSVRPSTSKWRRPAAARLNRPDGLKRHGSGEEKSANSCGRRQSRHQSLWCHRPLNCQPRTISVGAPLLGPNVSFYPPAVEPLEQRRSNASSRSPGKSSRRIAMTAPTRIRPFARARTAVHPVNSSKRAIRARGAGAPGGSKQPGRDPVNLAFVLDRSGSMSGQKLEFAKRASRPRSRGCCPPTGSRSLLRRPHRRRRQGTSASREAKTNRSRAAARHRSRARRTWAAASARAPNRSQRPSRTRRPAA